MSVGFHAQVARVTPEGQVLPLDGPENRWWMRSSDLYALLENVANRKGLVLREAETWPWYFGSHDGSGRQGPSPSNCFDPVAVRRSLQELERDLKRYDRTTPARWEFSWVDPAGIPQRADTVQVIHSARNCVLFGDEDGVWFKETDAGPRQGVHHKLGKPLEVVARLPSTTTDIVIGVRRISRYRDCENDLASFKRLCMRALDQKALVFTSAG